tara:strand:+ start:132 stop:284 length:153 start_codon:yes stop_codon:yes gene_type:complete
MSKNKKIFFLWLLLVVLWNYKFPEAKPIYDVLAAVGLSFFSTLLNKMSAQ